MSLYGTRRINVGSWWQQIPGEGRQVRVHVQMAITATPDDVPKCEFQCTFGGQELRAPTQSKLRDVVRGVAEKIGGTKWYRFLACRLEFAPDKKPYYPLLVEASSPKKFVHDRTRTRQMQSDGSFAHRTGVIWDPREDRHKQVYLPDTQDNRHALEALQAVLTQDISNSRKALERLGRLTKSAAPRHVEGSELNREVRSCPPSAKPAARSARAAVKSSSSRRRSGARG